MGIAKPNKTSEMYLSVSLIINLVLVVFTCAYQGKQEGINIEMKQEFREQCDGFIYQRDLLNIHIKELTEHRRNPKKVKICTQLTPKDSL